MNVNEERVENFRNTLIEMVDSTNGLLPTDYDAFRDSDRHTQSIGLT